MSSPFEATSHLRVSDSERGRVEAFLQDAYAEGRLERLDFDRRIAACLSAQTRSELDASYRGLPLAPLARTAVQPPARPTGRPGPGSALIHLSGLPTMFVGPAIAYAVTSKGTIARREAAKALNFQITSLILFAVLGVVSGVLGSGVLAGLWGVAWFVLTILSGVRAAQGVDYRTPVAKALPLRFVSEERGRRA